MPSSLIPGVSTSSAPCSRTISWRREVACVPSPVGAGGPGGERLAAEQAVDERRLAHARRTEQAVGPARDQELPEAVHSGMGGIAQCQYPGRDAGLADGRDRFFQLFRGDQVGLGQDQHRLDAPVAGHHQVAVQPVQVEIIVARLDDEGGVDVGRDHLQVHVPAGGFAAQEGPSRQDAVDDGRRPPVVVLNAGPNRPRTAGPPPTRRRSGTCPRARPAARRPRYG